MEANYITQFKDKSQYKTNDPNNTFWAKDESRFGLKMLKNMGWSEGNGLGAKEDGSTNHIAIKKKNNNSGIGDQNNSSDNWLQGAFNYNNLLKRLNSTSADKEDGEEGKEEASKSSTKKNKSKQRHLYQRRLASKDSSAYSKEDLSAILGTQKLQEKAEEEEESDSVELSDEDEFLRPTTMSVTDYFVKKGAVGLGYGDKNRSDDKQEEEEEDGDLMPTMGLGMTKKKRKREDIDSPDSSEVVVEPKSKKSKKEKKEKKEKSKDKDSKKETKKEKRRKEKKKKRKETKN